MVHRHHDQASLCFDTTLNPFSFDTPVQLRYARPVSELAFLASNPPIQLPYILVYWHDLCYSASGSGNLSRVWTNENRRMNKLIRAMTRAGVRVTPENVEAIQKRLFAKVWLNDDAPKHLRDALTEANRLLGQMHVIQRPRTRPATVATPAWDEAKATPLSNAAAASLQDRLRARNRPGGRIMRRPRWSLDEPPLGGWDVGDPKPARPRRDDEDRRLIHELWQELQAAKKE